MRILMAVLGILSILLFILLFLIKKEIRSVKRQLQERRNGVEKPIALVLIDRDLMELAAEINLNQSIQKGNKLSILKRERQLKESISNLSHDLRTPLTSMTGYLQLLQKTELTEEQREYLGISVTRGRYLQTLIHDFYDISLLEDLEEQETMPVLERIHLDPVLTDAVLSFTNQFKEKNMTPSIQFSDQLAYVRADEVMLKRILTNLVSNALRYGSEELAVRISCDAFVDSHGDFVDSCGDFVEVEFENKIRNGETIEADRLFDKFYTANSSRSHSGSGLGLYIVKVLAEKMGGGVSAGVRDGRVVIRLVLVKG